MICPHCCTCCMREVGAQPVTCILVPRSSPHLCRVFFMESDVAPDATTAWDFCVPLGGGRGVFFTLKGYEWRPWRWAEADWAIGPILGVFLLASYGQHVLPCPVTLGCDLLLLLHETGLKGRCQFLSRDSLWSFVYFFFLLCFCHYPERNRSPSKPSGRERPKWGLRPKHLQKETKLLRASGATG